MEISEKVDHPKTAKDKFIYKYEKLGKGEVYLRDEKGEIIYFNSIEEAKVAGGDRNKWVVCKIIDDIIK